MGNLRVSNEVILAKVETTYNTDAAPVVATNAVLVQNPTMSSEGLRMNERNVISANINQQQQIYGGTLARLSFSVELKGSGAAGTAPEIGALLKGCAMQETIVASTSVTYKPRSSSHDSLTMWWYEGGRKVHKLTGCRGNVTFRVEAGGIAVADFEFVGHITAPADISLPSPTYLSTVPVASVGMAVSLGGVTSMIVRSWNLTLNNTIAMPPSLAATDGYGEVQVTRQDVAGEIVMDAELASVIDVDTQLFNGTGLTFASGTLGSTAGNRVAFTGATNKLYWRDRNFSDADGMRIRTMPFGIADSSSGNDAISVAFT
jgi:Phage tail tube protein